MTAIRFDPVLGQFLDGLVSVGLQPFLWPEAGLEGRHQLFLGPAKTFADQSRRFQALAMIGVALEEIGLRNAVERGEHDFGLPIETGEWVSIDCAMASI
jgi:hypothetical protein